MADASIAVDFVLEDLEQILTKKADLILAEMDQVECLFEDLKFIRVFLKELEDNRIEDEQLERLVAQIKDVACEALEVLDSYVVDVLSKSDKIMAEKICQVFDHYPRLRHFNEEIKSLKKRVTEFKETTLYAAAVPVPVPEDAMSSTLCWSRELNPSDEDDETVVGFEDEEATIKEQLVGNQKQLEVISVVGMAGIGKTTLARKLYYDPFIVYHFYIRAWTYMSQVYRKKDLLIRILSSIIQDKNEINLLTDEKLSAELYRRLKGKRYLIIVDDVWDFGAWEDLRRCFPDDSNGSRIIITTRLKDLALHIKPNPIHCMRFLTEQESWDLFIQKAFRKRSCPKELLGIGKEIVAKCQGLPLAIVVVAGLLAKKPQTEECWIQVARSVSSFALGDAEQLMDILMLSYSHLSPQLKSCFLYLGEFPEDCEIPIWKLTCLWIAEGFVEQVANKSLEDVAEDYLMDLVDRNLVIVAKRRSNGGIKSCRVHDMLHDLSLRKAKDKKLLEQFNTYKQVALPGFALQLVTFGPHICGYKPAASSIPILHEFLCFHSHGFHDISGNPCEPYIRTCFCYARQMQIGTYIFKLLRVLDLWYIDLDYFPVHIFELVHLKYLALRVYNMDKLSPKISNLWSLQNLVLHNGQGGAVTLPHCIWKMINLRHLRISSRIQFEKIHSRCNDPCILENLQTIYALPLSDSIKDTEYLLANSPNLRKVRLVRTRADMGKFIDLANLVHLETLKLTGGSLKRAASSIPQLNRFPPNMKKLTLSFSKLNWKELSVLGRLPRLEVLKLADVTFVGPRWETSDGEFRLLKYLKISRSKLKQWITSSSHFPRLEQLVLDGCFQLDEIPSELGDIPTLQMIEVNCSSNSAVNSAREIQEKQHRLGNDELKIHIRQIDMKSITSDFMQSFQKIARSNLLMPRSRSFGA